MSTGLTPVRRHGGLENVSRALAVLTALLLAGIVVMVLVDRSSNTLNSQGGTGSGVASMQARSLPPFTGVDLTATHGLDASISGSGTILYAGNPAQVTKSVTGSGMISAESSGRPDR